MPTKGKFHSWSRKVTPVAIEDVNKLLHRKLHDSPLSAQKQPHYRWHFIDFHYSLLCFKGTFPASTVTKKENCVVQINAHVIRWVTDLRRIQEPHPSLQSPPLIYHWSASFRIIKTNNFIFAFLCPDVHMQLYVLLGFLCKITPANVEELVICVVRCVVSSTD